MRRFGFISLAPEEVIAMGTMMYTGDASDLFWVAYFACPLDANPTNTPRGSGQMVRSPTDPAELEDTIRETVENWTELEQATTYWYLHAYGVNLERAKVLRHKVEIVP